MKVGDLAWLGDVARYVRGRRLGAALDDPFARRVLLTQLPAPVTAKAAARPEQIKRRCLLNLISARRIHEPAKKPHCASLTSTRYTPRRSWARPWPAPTGGDHQPPSSRRRRPQAAIGR